MIPLTCAFSLTRSFCLASRLRGRLQWSGVVARLCTDENVEAPHAPPEPFSSHTCFVTAGGNAKAMRIKRFFSSVRAIMLVPIGVRLVVSVHRSPHVHQSETDDGIYTYPARDLRSRHSCSRSRPRNYFQLVNYILPKPHEDAEFCCAHGRYRRRTGVKHTLPRTTISKGHIFGKCLIHVSAVTSPTEGKGRAWTWKRLGNDHVMRHTCVGSSV